MQEYFNNLAFAGFLFTWIYYMYSKEYQFAMFADRFSGFGDRLGDSLIRKSGFRIKVNLGWVMMAILTLAYLVIALIVVLEIVKWLPHPVLLWVIPLLSGCIYFFRDYPLFKKSSKRKTVRMLQILLIGAIASGWYLHPSWWTYNTVAFIVGITTIRAMSPMRLRYLLSAMAVIILYDIYGVFLSGKIVQVLSTTVGVSRFIPPVVILTPFSDHMLGLADVVFPGLMVVTMFQYGLGIASFTGFGAGLGLTYVVLFATGRPLPAMLFILPMTVLIPLATAMIKGIKLDW